MKIINFVKNNNLLNNVIVLASGTAGAQAIGIIISPVITRLYTPEAIGILGVFVAIQAIFNPIASLSLPLAIVLPKKNHDAKKISTIALIFSCAINILLLIVIVAIGDILIEVFSIKLDFFSFILLPIAVLLATLMAIFTQWINRAELFEVKAKAVLWQSAFINLSKVIIGLLYPTALMLVMISVLGGIVHALYLWGAIRNRIDLFSSIPRRKKDIIKYKRIIFSHRDFIYYRTPQIVLDSISFGLPILMLTAYIEPAAAGYYSLARTILGLPATLIGEAVSSVFYPRITNAIQNKENAKTIIIKATVIMAIVGIFPFGIVGLFGPYLFEAVFGENWYTAGMYAQWLALWSFSGFINRPSMAAFPILNLQGALLIIEIISIMARVIGLLIGFYFFSSGLIAVAIFSVISVLTNVAIIILGLNKSNSIQAINRD